MQFIPYEYYPDRICLDITEYFKDFVKDKIVCDIGCGKGDLLEYMKNNNLCKEVIGLEINKKRLAKDRKYILNKNALEITLPEADVYIFWLGKQFPYEKILKKISSEKIIIYMDSNNENQNIFENYSGIKLMKKIKYQFDETKFINPENLNDRIVEFEKLSKINNTWTLKGERFFCIYKYNPLI